MIPYSLKNHLGRYINLKNNQMDFLFLILKMIIFRKLLDSIRRKEDPLIRKRESNLRKEDLYDSYSFYWDFIYFSNWLSIVYWLISVYPFACDYWSLFSFTLTLFLLHLSIIYFFFYRDSKFSKVFPIFWFPICFYS
jgi:hypothetical protein